MLKQVDFYETFQRVVYFCLLRHFQADINKFADVSSTREVNGVGHRNPERFTASSANLKIMKCKLLACQIFRQFMVVKMDQQLRLLTHYFKMYYCAAVDNNINKFTIGFSMDALIHQLSALNGDSEAIQNTVKRKEDVQLKEQEKRLTSYVFENKQALQMSVNGTDKELVCRFQIFVQLRSIEILNDILLNIII